MGGLPFGVGSKGELRDLASYHYGTLRGTLQQPYPLHIKGFGTAQNPCDIEWPCVKF